MDWTLRRQLEREMQERGLAALYQELGDIDPKMARRVHPNDIHSTQVYRGMDIGTDKPSQGERREVTHRLIDLVNPDEPFNAGKYRRHAVAEIDRLHQEHRIPLVVGGTGLYVPSTAHSGFVAIGFTGASKFGIRNGTLWRIGLCPAIRASRAGTNGLCRARARFSR